MTYMGNKVFWDQKFSERSNKALAPEAVIIKYSELLKGGSVLDIACGDGRNSLYLTEKGFEVTGIDFSPAALDRMKGFAEKKQYDITAIEMDLSQPTSMEQLGIYDNCVVSHYKLDEATLLKLKNHIKPDGILIITGFGHKHICDERITTDDLIYRDDFLVLKEAFELINYEESIDERGFFTTYVFQRR